MMTGETICEPKTGAAADYINFLDMQTGERQGAKIVIVSMANLADRMTGRFHR